MSEIYTVIVVILGILAVSGLFVGVTNDAVNFLTSAIGSKAAPMKTILGVASVGILLGVVTSSGMMEVARSGMFNPGLFTFHEVMMLYLGVMFANIILLDLYNSWGLPTSTTVSLVFCLLGSAIAVSIYKISNDPTVGAAEIGHYINATRALGIVSAILLSVVIAFTCGTAIMYLSRLIFTFRYIALFRCGAAPRSRPSSTSPSSRGSRTHCATTRSSISWITTSPWRCSSAGRAARCCSSSCSA